jgi:hypothetical protein
MTAADLSNISGGFPDIASGGDNRFCPFLISVIASRRFERYGYQLDEKPGWILVPTFSGGSIPLWVVPSSGELLVDLEVPDLWSSGEVMATCQVFRRGDGRWPSSAKTFSGHMVCRCRETGRLRQHHYCIYPRYLRVEDHRSLPLDAQRSG